MREVLVGVDIGSTNLKVAAFDAEGKMLFCESRPMLNAYHSYSNQKYEYADPEYIYGAIAEMLRSAADNKAEPFQIAAIAITGMGDDGVPLNAGGEPAYPVISWKCKRTIGAYRHFEKDFGFFNYFRITGLQARNMDTIFKLMWLRENEPEIYAGMSHWLFIEDYIAYRLCGEIATDPSIASTSGLLDLEQEQWSEKLCEYASINKKTLPPLVRGGEKVGKVTARAARETGVPKGVPVIMGGWDIQCAAVALGGLQADYVVDTMGTWETVNIMADKPMLTRDFFNLGFHVCNHVVSGLYTYPVFLLSSRIVEWFLDKMYLDVEARSLKYARLTQDAAQAGPGAGGVMFLPHLSGSYFPQIDPNSKGAFLGITEQTGKPELSRALLEGLTYMTSQVIYGCERILGHPLEDIVVTGGGVKNAVWMNIKASVLNRTLNISNTAEDTALGAAMLAGVGCKVFKSLSEAQRCMAGTRSKQCPQLEEVAFYRNQLGIYEKLYGTLKEINLRLSDNHKKMQD